MNCRSEWVLLYTNYFNFQVSYLHAFYKPNNIKSKPSTKVIFKLIFKFSTLKGQISAPLWTQIGHKGRKNLDVTTVTFNSILVIVFLFLLNVGVSPCFHCTLLVLVYRMYTFFPIIYLSVPVTGYILPVCIMKLLLLVSVWTCGFNLLLICVNSREFMRECTHTVWLMVSLLCFYMMGLGANFTRREVASSANSYANCDYDIYQGTFST